MIEHLYIWDVGNGDTVVWTEIMPTEWKESEVIYGAHAQA